MLALALAGACASAPVATAPDARGLAAEGAPAEKGEYDLSRLPVLSEVIRVVDRTYVDPKRIVPKAMVVAAMDHVERAAGEVMSEGDAGTGKLVITVGTARETFDISGMRTIFDVRVVLGEVLAFLQRNLADRDRKNLREVEYAAVNGMLSTLDPHTMLYDPRALRDLRTTTRGESGGVGLVIKMREGNLTVLKALRNSPAQRAGIKPKDVITVIEDRSTVNMDVQDAVDLLRGKPGSTVALSVGRPGSKEPWRLQLVREIINLETIPRAKLLEKQIGYVRISQFAAYATRDLRAAINAERIQAGGELRGFILDLRDNPGGLLDQVIQVSDLFLSKGVIVKTVSVNGTKRTEAHPDPNDLADLPIVLIVNHISAGASEFLAAALKDNNRALVIGRQTFGAGLVQVLHDFPAPGPPGDSLALKLSIAHFLTPGDVSIHEVGVTPDVLLLPGRVLAGAVSWFAPTRTTGEGLAKDRTWDWEKRAQERRRHGEKAPMELPYLLDEKMPEQREDEADDNPDEFTEDYQIRFARDLLTRAPVPDRLKQLEAARALVAEKQAQEESRLEARLAQLGVNWSTGPTTGNPRAVVTVSPPSGKRVEAGGTVPWTVTVENLGDGPFHRLRAWTLVDENPILDRREFVFGLVKPGEKRSWTVPLELPRSLDSRQDDVTLHFEADGGHAPPDVFASFDLLMQPHPRFAFSVQVDDEAAGNGDGLIERGETISLHVDVRNAGEGASGEKTYVSVKSPGDEMVFLKEGRAVIGALEPGEVRTASLRIDVKKGLKLDKVPLLLRIVDEKTEEFSAKIELPVLTDGPARTPARGGVRIVGGDALLKSGADDAAAPIALAKKGAVLPALARVGGYYKVRWQKGRFGFVAAEVVKVTPRAKPEARAGEVWQREAPRVALVPDPAKGAPVVDTEIWRIEGTASAPPPAGGATTPLRDLFVLVNDKKVFFKIVPENSPASSIDFAAECKLKPGNNTVTVHARTREDEESGALRTVHVYRRPPAKALQ